MQGEMERRGKGGGGQEDGVIGALTYRIMSGKKTNRGNTHIHGYNPLGTRRE